MNSDERRVNVYWHKTTAQRVEQQQRQIIRKPIIRIVPTWKQQDRKAA